jgi:hypothetical protein
MRQGYDCMWAARVHILFTHLPIHNQSATDVVLQKTKTITRYTEGGGYTYLKHPDGFSRWPTIAVDPKNKEHKVIKDEISGQLCRERRSSKRPKHSKKQQDSYEVTQGGGLPSIPERIHVSLPPSSRTRREGSISDVSALPTTEDHPRPVSTENSTPRQPSSNRSHWVAVIVEEAKTEERMGGELEEEGGEADIIEEGKEGEAERGPNRPAGEAEVTVVAVAGES